MKSITLPATLDSLSTIRDFVRESAEEFGLVKDSAYKLALALDEIVTNTVNYGYAGSEGEVVLLADSVDGEMVVTVTDSAPAFDPKSISLPTAEDISAPLDERMIGGLGIFLVLNDIDRFEYQRYGSKNVNIFAMKIKS